jgi:hypothetical protein
MATKRPTKEEKPTKEVATATSRVRPATVKEAAAWLNLPSLAGGRKFDRVIAAIRDPKDSHRLVTIVIHE